MLYIKQIFLLFILLKRSNAIAVESKTEQLIDKNEMEAKLESTPERTSESTTIVYDDNSTFSYEEVYYSIIDSPVQCKVNERLDYTGRCRVVF